MGSFIALGDLIANWLCALPGALSRTSNAAVLQDVVCDEVDHEPSRMQRARPAMSAAR
jgi:hypothetical protein